MKRNLMLVAAFAAFAAAALPARAGDIIEEWASVKAPAVLPLKDVTLDPKTTALLMGDFQKPNCTNRPRCMASLPAMKKFLAEARAKGVFVIYSQAGKATIEDILPDVAPKKDEPIVRGSVDKFVDANLEKLLKEKGIKTLIATGTAAHGVVLYTASIAALKGYDVVVPVDGMSSEDPYYEQATAWLLAKGTGGIGPKVTLTRTTMVKF